jgi:hypothetical protein
MGMKRRTKDDKRHVKEIGTLDEEDTKMREVTHLKCGGVGREKH